MSPQPSFVCPRCGRESFLPSDIAAGYCAGCRWWTGDSLLGSPEVIAQAELDGPLLPLGGQLPEHVYRLIRDAGISAADFSLALGRVGRGFASLGEALARWRDSYIERQRRSPFRVTTKRLRHGRYRRRVREFPPAQPEPWKVRR